MPSKKESGSPEMKSVWESLSAIDCNDHTEDKNGFTYLSWAWAWKTLKEIYPTVMAQGWFLFAFLLSAVQLAQ